MKLIQKMNFKLLFYKEFKGLFKSFSTTIDRYCIEIVLSEIYIIK